MFLALGFHCSGVVKYISLAGFSALAQARACNDEEMLQRRAVYNSECLCCSHIHSFLELERCAPPHPQRWGCFCPDVCACAFVTYWVECGLQLCLIILNFSLHRLHMSWTVSAFQSHLCCPCCPPPSCFSPQPPQPKTPEVPWSETDSAVFHLSDESFDSFLEEHPAALVMFYAPCE